MNLRETIILLERQDYIGMFGDILAIDAKLKPQVDKYITWARQTLRKNDRIIWFLRLVRLKLASQINLPQDAIGRMNNLTKYPPGDIDRLNLNNLMTTLGHFVVMPIRDLQNVVWDRQLPDQLIQEFERYEENFRKAADDDVGAEEMARNGRLIQRDKEDQIIIRCPDGLCWVDLEKGNCSIEGRAMGHCGNGAGRNGETVLSLRKPVNHRGVSHWYPVLTFILDDNHMLGEMKGRGNKKPAKRYHDDIIILLRSDYVNGIKGGGYLPQNNFSLKDLDPSVADELVEEKPELGGVQYIYEKEGMTERVQSMLNDTLNSEGITTPNNYVPGETKFGGHFELDSWEGGKDYRTGKTTSLAFETFLRAIYDSNLEKILDIALGQDDDYESTSPAELFVAMTQELPPSWQDSLIKRAGNPGGTEPHDDKVHYAALELIRARDDWYETFEDIVNERESRREEAWERIADYVDQGWYFNCHYVYTNIPYRESAKELRAWIESNTPITLLIGERELVNLATADDEDDEYYERGPIRQHGWESLDDNDDRERHKEAGLIDRNGDDIWLKDNASVDKYYLDDFIAAISGAKNIRIRDPRQSELRFESLQRLRQLAGLKLPA